MAINIVQFARGTGTSSIPNLVTNTATFTATFPNPVTTGNSILLFTAGNSGFENYVLGVTAVSDTGGNNYGTALRNDVQGGGAIFAKPLAKSIWYIPSVTGGSALTISATWSQRNAGAGPQSNTYNIVAMELSGCGSSSSILSSAGGNTAGGAGHPETATITNSLSASITVNFLMSAGNPNAWEALDLFGDTVDFLIAVTDEQGPPTTPTATGYTFVLQNSYAGDAALSSLWSLAVPFGPTPPPPGPPQQPNPVTGSGPPGSPSSPVGFGNPTQSIESISLARNPMECPVDTSKLILSDAEPDAVSMCENQGFFGEMAGDQIAVLLELDLL